MQVLVAYFYRFNKNELYSSQFLSVHHATRIFLYTESSLRTVYTEILSLFNTRLKSVDKYFLNVIPHMKFCSGFAENENNGLVFFMMKIRLPFGSLVIK